MARAGTNITEVQCLPGTPSLSRRIKAAVILMIMLSLTLETVSTLFLTRLELLISEWEINSVRFKLLGTNLTTVTLKLPLVTL
jgi:hypothetical protein